MKKCIYLLSLLSILFLSCFGLTSCSSTKKWITTPKKNITKITINYEKKYPDEITDKKEIENFVTNVNNLEKAIHPKIFSSFRYIHDCRVELEVVHTIEITDKQNRISILCIYKGDKLHTSDDRNCYVSSISNILAERHFWVIEYLGLSLSETSKVSLVRNSQTPTETEVTNFWTFIDKLYSYKIYYLKSTLLDLSKAYYIVKVDDQEIFGRDKDYNYYIRKPNDENHYLLGMAWNGYSIEIDGTLPL